MVYDANQLVALDREHSNSWPNPPNYEYLKGTNVQKARLFLIKNRATVALANLLGAVNPLVAAYDFYDFWFWFGCNKRRGGQPG